MKKADLRKHYLAKRKALSTSELEKKSERIADVFFREVDLKNVNVIHVFLPIQRMHEPNLWLITRRLWRQHPYLRVVTSVTEKGRLKHVEITATTLLIEDEWGIPTPQNTVEVDIREIDMVLAPLLAIDADGHRVGYGKGYYDGFLSQCRDDVQTIGISLFPVLEQPIEDVFERDIALKSVITPDGVTLFDN